MAAGWRRERVYVCAQIENVYEKIKNNVDGYRYDSSDRWHFSFKAKTRTDATTVCAATMPFMFCDTIENWTYVNVDVVQTYYYYTTDQSGASCHQLICFFYTSFMFVGDFGQSIPVFRCKVYHPKGGV